MSTLPVLVTALAEVDGRDRATLEHFARTIRQAGYITTGKRGMGAAKITFREAANLLIALNGADSATDSPVAIDRFRSLQQFHVGATSDLRAWAASYEKQPQPIKDVMDTHTFGEALEALLEGAPEIAAVYLDHFKEDYSGFPASSFLEFMRLYRYGIEITFARYSAKIETFRSMLSGTRIVDFTVDYRMDPDRVDQGFYGPTDSDRKVFVTIGLPTLIAVWRGLHPDADIFSAAGGARP